MLAKIYRLTSATDFKRVKEKGHLYQSKNFSLSIFDRGSGDTPRFGFILPNKVIPLSTNRNRIRRMLSEATRYQVSSVSPTIDCVFLPKASIASAYAADVMHEVQEAFTNAHITKAV